MNPPTAQYFRFFALSHFSKIGWFLVLCGLILGLSGCTPSAPTIRVGSKDYTEQLIIGEMYALLLEEAGFKVDRRLNLGGTPIAHQALLHGEIDLYPEYTGTGLLTVLKQPLDPLRGKNSQETRQQVYDAVSRDYKTQFDLIWLDPAPLNNTQALAMLATQAKSLGIQTIADLRPQAAKLRLIGPPEFAVREDGLPGLEKAYGNFNWKDYKAVDAGLRYQGIMSGGADVAVAFSTDGEINAFGLVLLEDDRQFFPPYQVAPVVRQSVLEQYPNLADTLNRLSPELTDAVMQELNYEVNGKYQEPATVAKVFLKSKLLIPSPR